MSITTQTGAAGEHAGEHPRFLAHHFESHDQQFDAGKLGMWLFLVQEILFFSGLFCAYAIYRGNHPEIFAYADHFLDRKLGLLNTCILIFSSFTVAWAVRAVQLEQTRRAIFLLVVTVLCAFAFLGVKAVEYHHKFHDGLLWGKNFAPTEEAYESLGVHDKGPHAAAQAKGITQLTRGADSPTTVSPQSAAAAPKTARSAPLSLEEESTEHPAGPPVRDEASFKRPHNVHIFFGIYFAMTGLHAVHILIGIGVIIWMIIRTARGDFHKGYYAPVEYTGLYWHLVDLVWIYLFPLLYLIH
jgi:cytochrome c oxidase subunit 3